MKVQTQALAWLWLLLGLAGLATTGWMWGMILSDTSSEAVFVFVGVVAYSAVLIAAWSGPLLTAAIGLLRGRAWAWLLLLVHIVLQLVVWVLVSVVVLDGLRRGAEPPSAAWVAGDLGVGGLLLASVLLLRQDPPPAWGAPVRPPSRVRTTHH